MTINHIAIVGYGALGKLLHAYIPDSIKVSVFDKGDNLVDACASDVIILSVPISAYGHVFPELAQNLNNDTLLVDVCSVKLESQAKVDEYFPAHPNVLISHPMFGPESAKETMRDRQWVVCRESGTASEFMAFMKELHGPKIVRMSADEHDRIMADMHALTFFIARGLTEVGIEPHGLTATSYAALLDLQNLDLHHSDELIETIERYNPYASKTRQRFIAKLSELHQAYANEG